MENLYKISPYRHMVVGANTKVPIVYGKMTTAINLDNAATTPPLISVMNKINGFMPWYSSVHRGAGYKSIYTSNLYESCRDIVKEFVNADPETYTVIFGKNTTEAINKLSYRLCRASKDSIILSTCIEHHSNDLPWRDKFTVRYVDMDSNGRLDLNDLRRKLRRYKNKVKLVAITGASNVTGYVTPIHKAAKIAHEYGSKIMIDGAQLVPHTPVNMRPDDKNEWIDYLVFSAHKMYAPFGTGVLVGLKETFKKGNPDYCGGGTVRIVTKDKVIWSDPPYKDEAGTPNMIGVLALGESIKTLNTLNMDKIDIYEKKLTHYALSELMKIPEVEIYSSKDMDIDRIGVIPFNINGVSHEVTAAILSNEAGISVRSGCFCAQPYVQRLLGISEKDMRYYMNHPDDVRPGMVRISFGMYNDINEIDILINLIYKIIKNRNMYLNRYYNDKVYYKAVQATKYSI